MDRKLTSHTGKELSRKTLNLAVWKRDKLVALEEIEYTLAKQVHDDADVASVVETVAEMNAPIAVFCVVGLERRQNPKLYPRGVPVLLHRTNNFDGNKFITPSIPSLDHFAECPLAEHLDHLVWSNVSAWAFLPQQRVGKGSPQLSVSSASGTTM